jgi:hypothetical protein
MRWHIGHTERSSMTPPLDGVPSRWTFPFWEQEE